MFLVGRGPISENESRARLTARKALVLSFFLVAIYVGGSLALPAASATPSCPTSTAYNPGADQCQATPTCPTGATFIASGATSRCVAAPTTGCPSGFTLNTSDSECDESPTCPSGTTFISVDSLCQSSPSCPSDTGLNGVLGVCYAQACPSGTTVSATNGDCEAPGCPAGTTYSSTYQACEAAPICPRGTSITENDLTFQFVCQGAPSCPTGSTFNVGIGMCEEPVTDFCPSGTTFSAVNQDCEVSPTCPSGGTANGNFCEVQADCPAFTGLETIGSSVYCNAGPVNQSCGFPSSETPLIPGISVSYDALTGKCEMPACQPTTGPSMINTTLFSSSKCVIDPVCPAGSYANSTIIPQLNVIYCHEDPACPPGTSYGLFLDTTPYMCVGGAVSFQSNPPCPTGEYDITLICVANPCPALSADFPGSVNFFGQYEITGPSGCTPPGSANIPYLYAGYDANHPGYAPTFWNLTEGISTSPTIHLVPTLTNDTADAAVGSDSRGYYVYSNDCVLYSSLEGGVGGSWTLTQNVDGHYVCQAPPACPAGTSVTDVFLGGSTLEQICAASPSCPSGETVSGENCIVSSITCPSGTSASNGACVTLPSCPQGTTTNGSNCDQATSCPPGTTFEQLIGCSGAAFCPSGSSLPFGLSGLPPNCYASVNCPAGTTVGTTCTAPASCPSGTTVSATFNGCDASPSCPSGTGYIGFLNACDSDPSCPSGATYNSNTASCEEGQEISCPSGNVYDAATGQCEGPYSCPSGTTFDIASNLCILSLGPIGVTGVPQFPLGLGLLFLLAVPLLLLTRRFLVRSREPT
jgi:hypothetical protein